MTLSAKEWTAHFARELGVPEPGAEEVEALLELAGVAAHASERTAAPISCWIAASASVAPARAREVAEDLVARLSTERTDDGP